MHVNFILKSPNCFTELQQ